MASEGAAPELEATGGHQDLRDAADRRLAGEQWSGGRAIGAGCAGEGCAGGVDVVVPYLLLVRAGVTMEAQSQRKLGQATKKSASVS